MNKLEKIKKELNRMDGFTTIDKIVKPEIEVKTESLFIIGAINKHEFTCNAKEFKVIKNSELSIIL